MEYDFYLIPGNPPAAYFYQQWIDEIKRVHTNVDVGIHYYPTFSKTHSSEEYLGLMKDFYLEKIQEYKRNTQKEVVLIGHSIGGHLALEVMKEVPGLVSQCVLLFPFLMRPGPKGKVMLELLYFIQKKSFIRKYLLNHFRKLKSLYPEIDQVSDEEIEACLHFSSHERGTVGVKRREMSIDEKVAKKVIAFSCANDTWCPSKSVKKMEQVFTHQKIEATHDFVTCPNQRTTVWKSISKSLKTY